MESYALSDQNVMFCDVTDEVLEKVVRDRSGLRKWRRSIPNVVIYVQTVRSLMNLVFSLFSLVSFQIRGVSERSTDTPYDGTHYDGTTDTPDIVTRENFSQKTFDSFLSKNPALTIFIQSLHKFR